MCEQMEKLKAEGVSIGEYNKAKTASINMYKKGQDIADIADTLEVSSDLVKQWISEKQ